MLNAISLHQHGDGPPPHVSSTLFNNVVKQRGNVRKTPLQTLWQRSKLTKELGWTLKPVTKVFLSTGFAYEMNVRRNLNVEGREFIVGHCVSCWWQQQVLGVWLLGLLVGITLAWSADELHVLCVAVIKCEGRAGEGGASDNGRVWYSTRFH